MLKLTFVTSSTFSCLIAETLCVSFSAGGAPVAEVAACPVVLPSAVGDLVSAVGDLVSAVGDFVSAVGDFVSAVGDLVPAVGFFMSLELVVGGVDSGAFHLLS